MKVGEIWRLKKHHENHLLEAADDVGVPAGMIRVLITRIESETVYIRDFDIESTSLPWNRKSFVKVYEREYYDESR